MLLERKGVVSLLAKDSNEDTSKRTFRLCAARVIVRFSSKYHLKDENTNNGERALLSGGQTLIHLLSHGSDVNLSKFVGFLMPASGLGDHVLPMR